MIFKKTAAAVLLLLLALLPAFSDENVAENDLEISIAFIGPADPLYSWWGHVAIIVDNINTGAAKYYDYGNFSFEQDSFVRNFIMGRLYFLKMGSSPDRQLRYSAFLNRDVTIYKLNTSSENAYKLYKFLENDILPENRVYLYDHFYDNCATRIRDMMDILTDGEFSTTYNTVSDKTLRTQLRRFTYSYPFMDWLLNFAIGGTIDIPATEYEGMFLPHELERGIASMTLHDSSGSPVPFAKEKIIYNRAEGRPEIPDYPPQRWLYGLAVGLALALPAWLLRRGSSRRKLKRNSLAAFSAVLSLALAVPGILLFFMAFFTNHTFTYRDMNLLFVNPFLFVTFIISLRLLVRPKASLRSLYCCWKVTLAGAVLSIILKLVPFLRQNNWETLMLILPVAIVLSGIGQRDVTT